MNPETIRAASAALAMIVTSPTGIVMSAEALKALYEAVDKATTPPKTATRKK